MTKVRSLKIQARQAAEWRGHEMGKFHVRRKGPDGAHSAVAICRRCHALAFVDAKPPPNGIDISGLAVAVDCPAVYAGWHTKQVAV